MLDKSSQEAGRHNDLTDHTVTDLSRSMLINRGRVLGEGSSIRTLIPKSLYSLVDTRGRRGGRNLLCRIMGQNVTGKQKNSCEVSLSFSFSFWVFPRGASETVLSPENVITTIET